MGDNSWIINNNWGLSKGDYQLRKVGHWGLSLWIIQGEGDNRWTKAGYQGITSSGIKTKPRDNQTKAWQLRQIRMADWTGIASARFSDKGMCSFGMISTSDYQQSPAA